MCQTIFLTKRFTSTLLSPIKQITIDTGDILTEAVILRLFVIPASPA